MSTLRLPDFLIAGAPRSGTTWLAQALDRHPRVWLAKPLRPEPKFFLVDELYAEGIESYSRRWFSDVPEGRVAGEKSTNYLESAQAADRIARHLPRVRLVFVLRDPVDRAVSNYRWSVMNGMEHDDLATALDEEDAREDTLPAELRYARPHAYFSRGLYAQLLRPWFALFPREQICCLRFEDARDRPQDVIDEVTAFLGVPTRADLVGEAGPVNPSVADVDVDPATLRRLRSSYEEPNRELAELLGPSFPLWQPVESAS